MSEAVFQQGDDIVAAQRLPSLGHVQRGKQLCARATCICCPAKQEQPVSHHMDKPQVRLIFQSLGWGEANGQMICPNCVRSRRTPPPQIAPHPSRCSGQSKRRDKTYDRISNRGRRLSLSATSATWGNEAAALPKSDTIGSPT